MAQNYNRPAKIDRNQPEIVKLYRELGALVLHTHTLKNCCDIIITYRGMTAFVEIKDTEDLPKYFWEFLPDQREMFLLNLHLTEGEKKYRDKVLANGGKYFIIYDRNTVFKSLGLKSVYQPKKKSNAKR